jgi:hypothetical protein
MVLKISVATTGDDSMNYHMHSKLGFSMEDKLNKLKKLSFKKSL